MKPYSLYYTLITLLFCIALPSQANNENCEPTLQRIVQEITRNNTQLRSFRQQANAQRLSNIAECTLPDPDVDIAYLFNTPRANNNRTNVSITQALNWDILTGKRKALTNAANTAVEKKYLQQTAQIMNEVDEALVDIVYYNILCNELSKRENFAAELLKLYTRKFEEGNATSIEMNKLRLNYSMCQAALKKAKSGRNKALGTLQILNGGTPLTVNDTTYYFLSDKLPSLNKLLSEYTNNTAISVARATANASMQAISVAKLQKLPTLKVGFQGEYNKEEKYSGLSLGISIPLWGYTRKKYKQAIAQAEADHSEAVHTEEKYSTMIKQAYQQAEELRQTSESLQANLAESDNEELLRKALNEGHISLVDYLLEQSFFYEAHNTLIDTQHEVQLSLARMRALLR